MSTNKCYKHSSEIRKGGPRPGRQPLWPMWPKRCSREDSEGSFLSPRQRFYIDHQLSVFVSDLFHTMPLESQRLSYYAFDEHESYPPSHRCRYQQEVLELIHAFKLFRPQLTHKFLWRAFYSSSACRHFICRFRFPELLGLRRGKCRLVHRWHWSDLQQGLDEGTGQSVY